MLATAIHLGFEPHGYERPDHPVQIDDRANHFRDLRNRVGPIRMGIDGCSVPTFALPLAALAAGFARLGSGEALAR